MSRRAKRRQVHERRLRYAERLRRQNAAHDRVRSFAAEDVNASPRAMRIGTSRVYRPSTVSERRFREELTRYAARRGLLGVYSNTDNICRVLADLLNHLSEIFSEAVTRLGSRCLAEGLLENDESWAHVVEQLKSGMLSAGDEAAFHRWGPLARRTTQYILERAVQLYLGELPSVTPHEFRFWLDRLLICGEEMVSLTDIYAQASRLFPDSVQLTISADYSGDWLSSEVLGELGKRFEEYRLHAYDATYKEPLGFGLREAEKHSASLNAALASVHGFTLADVEAMLVELREGAVLPSGCSIPFVLHSQVIEGLSESHSFSAELVQRALAPFTLTKHALDREERILWRSKQSNRLIRRPLLVLPHALGDHVCFSRRMLNPSFRYVLNDVLSANLPDEWATPDLKRCAAQTARSIDREWELEVHSAWEAAGLKGVHSLKTVRGTSTRTQAPPDVGEIDLIHYADSECALIVGEVKRLKPSFWSPEFADDKEKFAGRQGYVEKLLRKVAWVSANRRLVCEHLQRSGKMKVIPECVRVGHVIVTDFDTVAQIFADRTRIVSHTRLLREHAESGHWQASFQD
jgi:hypothetical protein